jgi:hypothetical protein
MKNLFGLLMFGIFLWWIAPKINDLVFPPRVDAFYYPNRNNLLKHEVMFGLKDVSACRDAVRLMARENGDPNLTRGDYECGVGFLRHAGDGLRVYKDTVK